jgi:hypothetical protein
MDYRPVAYGYPFAYFGGGIRGRMDDNAFFHRNSGADNDRAIVPAEYRPMSDIAVVAYYYIAYDKGVLAYIGILPDLGLSAVK